MTDAQNTHTVADQILDYLEAEDAKILFGVPGAGIMHLLQRLHARPDFRYLVCRQETGAAYMADGYYRATGKPGIVLVTSGPGATNALTGTMNAQFGGSAVLTITGEVAEAYLGRGYLQEGSDCGLNVRDLYAAATRYSADIPDASSAPILIEQALRDMLGLPRRAVRLGIFDNVAAEPSASTLSKRPPAHTSTYRTMPTDAPVTAIDRTLSRLANAKRPLILLGNGCRTALDDPEIATAFRNLVEWLQIPVMTTSDGKGVFPETHLLSLRSYGFAGCVWPQFWMQDGAETPAHDMLLVIGSSLGELATYKWNPMLIPAGPFVQIDIDQSVIGRGFPITDGIVAEAGAFIRGMWDRAPAVPRDEATVAARRSAIAAIKATRSPFDDPAAYESFGTPFHPASLCRVLNERLPENAMIFIDAGNCVGWGLHYLVVRPGQDMHSSLAMGPMGFGVGAVVGARFGRPDRLAVAFVGDGAFMMHLGEVSTASAYGIGAIWVVLSDNDLGMVTHGMETFFPKDPTYAGAYSLGSPDLEKAATGLGADAYTVQSATELAAAWDTIVAGAEAGRPQVVVAKIDTTPQPPYWNPPYWQ